MKVFVEYGTIGYVPDKRQYAVSARNKVDYLVETLRRLGEPVEVVSCARSLKRFGYCPQRVEMRENGVKLINAPALALGHHRLPKLMQTALMSVWLFTYLLLHVKKDEDLLMYHALTFAKVLTLAKRIKRFRLILEVEEVYHLLVEVTPAIRRMEQRLFDTADQYIFASEDIEHIVNTRQKRYAIFSGNYFLPESYCFPPDNGVIELVYAGSIKQGLVAFRALEVARFLPEYYRMHFVGYGESEDVSALRERMAEISRVSPCKVSYDGMLNGGDYARFLQKCHIGLSTQTTDQTFASACFPSKIASYLANGLIVVSSNSKPVMHSPLGRHVVFYEDDDPCKIAQTIMSIDLSQYENPRLTIARCDQQFQSELRNLIQRKQNDG